MTVRDAIEQAYRNGYEAGVKSVAYNLSPTDREKLIELLMQAKIGWTKAELADHLIANGVTFAKDTNVPSKWIPVTERLPEDGQRVLCFKQGKYASCIMTAAFSECLEKFCNVDFLGAKHSGFYNYDSEVGYYELREVTHWMPLPEPPKGE